MNKSNELKPQFKKEEPIGYLEDDWVNSLSSSPEYFKKLIDLVPIALMVVRDGLILYANQAYVRLMGFEKANELLGHEALELYPSEYHLEIKNRIKNIYQNREVYNPPMELQAIRRNGEKFFVEAESVAVIYRGEPAHTIIIRDISLRKKVQEELRKSEENFQNIIREMQDGVLITNGNQILFANYSLAQMLGYSFPSELEEVSTSDLVHPDYRAASRERVEKVMNGGGATEHAKFKLLGKNGKIVDVESSCVSVLFNGMKVLMAVMRDITIQNQMERQATLNDKLATVGTLAAGVAHEVNNPLTYVLGNLSFLKEQLDEMRVHTRQKNPLDTENQNLLTEMGDEVSDCIRGGERIRDIVKDLKAFVRTNEDEVVKVNINQMVESALNMTYHVFKQKARLEKDLAADLPFLMVHPGKIQQVFINLIINAAQAIEGNSPERNKIRIRTGRLNNNLFVEFTDTGKGIPDDILPRIFDPFFTTKPIGVGTGLGLSVCNEILRHHQGSLEVQSRLGEGTTFTVYLPLHHEHQDKAAEPPVHAGALQGRVLVVDDEPGNLEVICRSLNKKHEVLKALSGEEAMEILKKEGDRVDAIVSDVNMPGMTGSTFYRIVAKTYPGLEKRFVFMTGGVFSEETRSFLKSLPNICLEKPFKFEDLLNAVAQCGQTVKED